MDADLLRKDLQVTSARSQDGLVEVPPHFLAAAVGACTPPLSMCPTGYPASRPVRRPIAHTLDPSLTLRPSLVTPGQVSPHLHQIVGGVRGDSCHSIRAKSNCTMFPPSRTRTLPSQHRRNSRLIGKTRFNITIDPNTDIAKTSTCTSCRFKEDKSNYWTAVMYFKHPNGSFIRVR